MARKRRIAVLGGEVEQQLVVVEGTVDQNQGSVIVECGIESGYCQVNQCQGTVLRDVCKMDIV